MATEDAERLARSVDQVSPGRVYDYMLGGVHNYAVDREFADKQLEVVPEGRMFAVSNRAFLGRAVRFAVSNGIRQFVDIGSGLPTQGNVHEVADEAAPGECRVVYIDNEPIARAHAEILLERTADPERHRAIDADFFDGDALWQQVLDTGVIDPNEPVALLLVALLHFMPPETEPEHFLTFYMDQLPPGSLLVLTHGYLGSENPEYVAKAEHLNSTYQEQANSSVKPRSRTEIAAFFEGLEFADPGLVWLPKWRPDGEDPYQDDPIQARGLGGVAWKRSR